MDKFQISYNPRTGRGLSIVHMVDPIAIIMVDPGVVKNDKRKIQFQVDDSEYTLSLHHYFTTNMAGLDEKIGDELVEKLLNKAMHWFSSYLVWQQSQSEDSPEHVVFYPELEDAAAISVLHPNSFEIPSNEELASLEIGDHVKVCFNGERFWCEIVKLKPNKIYARVDNDLIQEEIKLHDLIVIQACNIYQILKANH